MELTISVGIRRRFDLVNGHKQKPFMRGTSSEKRDTIETRSP